MFSLSELLELLSPPPAPYDAGILALFPDVHVALHGMPPQSAAAQEGRAPPQPGLRLVNTG